MSESLGTAKSINENSLIDDKYRQTISKNASAILNLLFDSTPTNISELKTLNILVIGAGVFPGFTQLILSIQRISPNVEKAIFTIIEPVKSETDRFCDFISRIDLTNFAIDVEHSIHNVDIREYLTKIKNKHFDIIYFEQPNLMPIRVLLAKIGFYSAKLETSLRESIPFLKNVIKREAIIIATFLYEIDLNQLNILINYSLKIPTEIASLPAIESEGAFYGLGLIGHIESSSQPKENPLKIASSIKKQDSYYAWFALISILLFIITPSTGKLFSFFCTAFLLLQHSYGLRNLITKSIVILIQLSILFMVIHAVSK